jgi:hypothetical protein
VKEIVKVWGRNARQIAVENGVETRAGGRGVKVLYTILVIEGVESDLVAVNGKGLHPPST